MITRLIFLFAIGVLSQAAAGDRIADEYAVKGAFVLNFAKFVEWPPETFRNPGDPLTICVLGESPFGPAFYQAAREAQAGGRRIALLPIPDGKSASQCQIVFIGESEHKRWRSMLEEMSGASVLTVGEWDSFLASGGIINFKVDGEKIRIEINPDAAVKAKLRISSKLLSIARIARK